MLRSWVRMKQKPSIAYNLRVIDAPRVDNFAVCGHHVRDVAVRAGGINLRLGNRLRLWWSIK